MAVWLVPRDRHSPIHNSLREIMTLGLIPIRTTLLGESSFPTDVSPGGSTEVYRDQSAEMTSHLCVPSVPDPVPGPRETQVSMWQHLSSGAHSRAPRYRSCCSVKCLFLVCNKKLEPKCRFPGSLSSQLTFLQQDFLSRKQRLIFKFFTGNGNSLRNESIGYCLNSIVW